MEAKLNAPLRKIAYDRFKNRLFDRTLSPGSFVSQRELCDVLDSPMGAVREALKRLEAEGLVSLLPQRGIQIIQLNVRFVNEAFQFRMIVEQEGARKMAHAPNEPLLEDLYHRTSELKARVEAGDRMDNGLGEEGLRIDLELHSALIANLENSLISDSYQNIDDRVRLIRMNSRFGRDRLAVAMGEHLSIISALRQGDQERSLAALTGHISTSWRRALGDDNMVFP